MRGAAAVLAIGFLVGPFFGPLANVDFDLYGDAGSGWGHTSGGETIPGPAMEVDEGDSVTLFLYSDDQLPHRWHLDYDGDGVVDPGEPASDLFTDSTTYTFTADVPGTFTYVCTVHPSTMYGSWTTNAGPETHDVAVTGVTATPTTVTQGDPVAVTVLVENQGTVPETPTVTAYAGAIPIGATSVTIAAGATEAVPFTWDTTGVSPGDYAIRGTASSVPGETDVADNEMTDGTVTVQAPPPPPTGDLSARLVHRKAWPARHHFVVSRDGPTQTFHALVENAGPGPVAVRVVFTVHDLDGVFVGTAEAFGVVGVDAIRRFDAPWDTGLGRFRVVAECWFDSNGDGTYDGFALGTKEFSYVAVP